MLSGCCSLQGSSWWQQTDYGCPLVTTNWFHMSFVSFGSRSARYLLPPYVFPRLPSFGRSWSVTHCAFLPLPVLQSSSLFCCHLRLDSLSSCCVVHEQNHPPAGRGPRETADFSFCCLPFFLPFVPLFLLLSLAHFPSVLLWLFLLQIPLTWEGDDRLPASVHTCGVGRTSPLRPWRLSLCRPAAEPRPPSSSAELLQPWWPGHPSSDLHPLCQCLLLLPSAAALPGASPVPPRRLGAGPGSSAHVLPPKHTPAFAWESCSTAQNHRIPEW